MSGQIQRYELDTPRGRITIRATAETDALAYREIRLEALKNHPESFGADYEESLNHPLEHWQQRTRSSESAALFAAFVNDHDAPKIIGMTGIVRGHGLKSQHSGHIWGVYVHPEWRGLRLSDALLNACIDWAKTAQLRYVNLGVVSTNIPAVNCYLRNGFTVFGVEPEYIHYQGKYYDQLFMLRRLA